MKMEKIVIKKFIILYFLFLLIEILLSVILSLICGVFNNDVFYVYKSVNIPIWLNLWRLFYYSTPLTILFFVLLKYFKKIEVYKPIVFSIFNVLVFVALNFLYKFHRGLPTLEITESLFWVMALSIFLSPIILAQIPYFKKLMESI